MRFKTVGNKVDKAFIVIRNPSSTVTIPNGAPCYFTMAATGSTNTPPSLGVDVQNTAAAYAVSSGIGQNFFAGVVSSEQQQGAGNIGIGPGSYGEAQVWGFVQSLRLVAQTRANSSASFSTSSGAIGDVLQPATGTLAVTQITGSASTITTGVTVSYDAWSDIGSLPTAFSVSGSYSSAAATTNSGSVVVNLSGALQLGMYAILAQTFTVSGSASSLINSLMGASYGSSLSAGSSILYSTIAVNAFLQYL
jgi:hypothetical protein